MKFTKLAAAAAVLAVGLPSVVAGEGGMRRLSSTAIADSLTFPLVGTAVVVTNMDGSRANDDIYELDLITPPNGLFDGKASIAFLVHNAQEADYILGLEGIAGIRFDDEELNHRFFEANSPSGDTARLKRTEDATSTYSTVPGFDCYRDLAGSYSWLDDVAAHAYPGLNVTVTNIGPSWLKSTDQGGYELRMLKISSDNSNEKAPFFASSGIHAREIAPPEVNMRFAEMLLDGYGVDADITSTLDFADVHLLIQANPDGRYVAEINQSWFQRKNMHDENGGCSDGSTGVDLNRNFPFKWGPAYSGSSGDKCSQVYRGAAPSEPELDALIAYVEGIFPEGQRKADPEGANLNDAFADDSKGVFIDIHAYGNLIIWPNTYEELPTANDLELQTLARKFTSFNDHLLAGPDQKNFIGLANGATADYAHNKLGAAAFGIEIGSAFYQPCEEFNNNILPENLPILLYGAKIAGAPYMTPLGPDVMSVGAPFTSDAAFAPSLPQSDDLSVTVEVSDNARSDKIPGQGKKKGFDSGQGKKKGVDSISTGVQTIASVAMYVDGHPYGGGTPAPMSGDTTRSTATFSADIDLSALTLGPHALHIVATDSDGFEGPVSSRFFSICDPNDVNCGDGGGGGGGGGGV